MNQTQPHQKTKQTKRETNSAQNWLCVLQVVWPRRSRAGDIPRREFPEGAAVVPPGAGGSAPPVRSLHCPGQGNLYRGLKCNVLPHSHAGGARQTTGNIFSLDKSKDLPCPGVIARPQRAQGSLVLCLLLPSGGPCENAIVVVPGPAVPSPLLPFLRSSFTLCLRCVSLPA